MKIQMTGRPNSKRLIRKVQVVDPVFSLYGKAQTVFAKRQRNLAFIIDTAMWIQQNIIDVGDKIVYITRIQLLFIFIEAAMTIVFNAYNLSTVLVHFILKDDIGISIFMAITFYVYYIFLATHNTLITIAIFAQAFDKLGSTARIANQLSIYSTDDALRLRLLQFSHLSTVNLRQYTIFGLFELNGSFTYAVASGTVTYIIILLQYGGENDLLFDAGNQTTQQ